MLPIVAVQVVPGDPPPLLEERLLSADVGITATSEILEQLKQRVARHELGDAESLLAALRTQGYVGQIKQQWREATCFATGSDGDSCFALTFVIPRPPAFTLAHFLISLVDGVRDALVHAPASKREADEFVARDGDAIDIDDGTRLAIGHAIRGGGFA